MSVLRGAVYMLKMIGSRTEPWDTPQEMGQGGDAKPDPRTEKERDVK